MDFLPHRGLHVRWPPRIAHRLLLLPLLLGLAGCAGDARPVERDRGPRTVSSNIMRSDYAGSTICGDCHSKIYAAWKSSPMRNMTRLDADATRHGIFNGQVFEFMGDRITLLTEGDERFMDMQSKYVGQRRYRITKVIGGRTREDFVGIEVDSSGATHGGELIMPVSWIRRRSELRYKGYSVLLPERPGLKPGNEWRRQCIFCHNTPHQLATLYDDLHSPRRLIYQGAVSDNMLPDSRRWSLEIDDEEALQRALLDEIRLLRGHSHGLADNDTMALLKYAAWSTREHFDQQHLIEVGIGCEACHGGSAEHVATPRKRPSFAPVGKIITARPPPGRRPASRAAWINRTCRRCHTVLFSRYPVTWEGQSRHTDPGGSNINSGEARNFELGGCSQQLACTTCHDPHARDTPERLAELQSIAGNKVCLTCHGELSSDAALTAHSHHDPQSEGSICINCHMPKKNMALDYRLTRYHRIASPTDQRKVEADRPLECALCHPSSSVESLVTTMERWWGKRYDRQALTNLYGGTDRNVLEATLQRGKPHEQAVAIDVLGRTRTASLLPAMRRQLSNRLPLIRYYAREAIERITGRPLDLDMSLPGAELRRRAESRDHVRDHVPGPSTSRPGN